MGKIFTWDEIRLEQVPKLERFTEVLCAIEKDVEADRAIVGAIICGSVTTKTHTPRSDVDCLVLHRHASSEKLLRGLRNSCMEARIRNVPLAYIPLDWETANTPLHTISPTFAFHLAAAVEKGGLIKENPLRRIALNPDQTREDICSYFRNKINWFAKALIRMEQKPATEFEECRILQKTLEIPVHAARKLLIWRGIELEDDSRQAICRAYEEHVGGALSEMFKSQILALDREYNEELSRQLRQRDRAAYITLLSIIGMIALPAAYSFIRENGMQLLKTPFVGVPGAR